MPVRYPFETPNERPLDAVRYFQGRTIHLSSQIPAACRQALLTRVTDSEIMFLRDGSRISPTPEFSKYIAEEWKPFIRDLMDEIMILGVAAVGYHVKLDSDEQRTIVVPYVIKGSLGISYNITISEDMGRVGKAIYRFYRREQNQIGSYRGSPNILDTNVRIFTHFGYEPNMDGTLNSLASRLIGQELFISRMYEYNLNSCKLYSEGTLVVESVEAANQAVFKSSTVFADGDKHAQDAENTVRYNADELMEQQATRDAQLQAQMDEFRLRQEQQMVAGPNPLAFGTIDVPKMVPWMRLPPGSKAAKVNTTPGSIAGWKEINEIYLMFCAATYGVPANLIATSLGQRSTHDESGLLRSNFNVNIENWKKNVEMVLDPIYADIFGNEELAYLFKGFFKETVSKSSPSFKKTLVSQVGKKRKREQAEDDDDREDRMAFYDNDPTALEMKILSEFKVTRALDEVETGTGTAMITNKKLKAGTSEGAYHSISIGQAVVLMKQAAGTASGLDGVSDEYRGNLEFALEARRILDIINNRVNSTKVRVRYVNIPNISDEELMIKWALGFIPYPMFKQISRSLSNIPTVLTDGMPDSDKDPFSVELKLSMISKHYAKALAPMGIVGKILFPDVELPKPEGTTTTTSSSSSKKSKASSSSQSPESSKAQKSDAKKQKADKDKTKAVKSAEGNDK